MKNLKPIIAEKLVAMRKSRRLTQAQLAEKLGYSDKAISRWERGDTLPDIDVLYELCRFYGISLDFLVDENSRITSEFEKDIAWQRGNKIALCTLAISIVWLIATCIVVYINIYKSEVRWQIFIWAVPISCIVGMIFNHYWGKEIFVVPLRSLTMWLILVAVYIQFLSYNIWMIFIIGVPSQLMIVLWQHIKSARRKYKTAVLCAESNAVCSGDDESD